MIVVIICVHIVHYIPGTYLSYNWKFVLLTAFFQFPLPPTIASGNLISLSMSLFVCLFVHGSFENLPF